MKEFHSYDPSEVSFTFGNIKLGGFQDGTFIKVMRDEDGWMKHAGSLGDVTRTRNLNRMGSIEVTLMAQSVYNDYLNAIASQDEQFGTGFRPALVEDHNGSAEAHATYAWVRKIPDLERAKEPGSTVWVFDCADLELSPGGNVALPQIPL